MKDSKISLLVLVSLALLLLAFVVLFVWGFSFYKQSIKQTMPATIVVKDSSSITSDIRDSLQKVYTVAINQLYTQLDSAQINSNAVASDMDLRLKEFYSLREEINLLLQKKPSDINLSSAQVKITELQQRVNEWRNKYADVSAENKRLSEILKKMGSPKVNNPTGTNNISTATNTNVEPSTSAGSITVTDVALKAFMQLDDKEKETFEALQTDIFRVSLDVKSSKTVALGEELYVVLLQPDGKLMKQSDWETGFFQTRDGRKLYSYKLRFDSELGETTKLSFSMPASNCLKGNYSIQVYHNGMIVAKLNKKLS
jgi:hypothetical protein